MLQKTWKTAKGQETEKQNKTKNPNPPEISVLNFLTGNYELKVILCMYDNNDYKWLFCCSVAKSCSIFMTSWTEAFQASLSFTISLSLLKLMSIESVMPSKPSHPLFPLLLLPSIFPSIRVFPREPALYIRWPKYWSFSFSISFSNEYSGLISFRIDWFGLLVVQGTLESLFQNHNFKASILWCSAFFMV